MPFLREQCKEFDALLRGALGSIQIVVAFDGASPPLKRATQRERFLSRLEQNRDILSLARRERVGRFTSAYPLSVPIFAPLVAAETFKELGCTVAHCIGEADPWIADEARRLSSVTGCADVLVLSDDSDFFTLDLGKRGRYAPLGELLIIRDSTDSATALLRGVAFGRRSIGEGLLTRTCVGLSVDSAFRFSLPLLSAAAGNDFTLPRDGNADVALLRRRIFAHGEVSSDVTRSINSLRAGSNLVSALLLPVATIGRALATLHAKNTTLSTPVVDRALADAQLVAEFLELSRCNQSCSSCARCGAIAALEHAFSFCRGAGDSGTRQTTPLLLSAGLVDACLETSSPALWYHPPLVDVPRQPLARQPTPSLFETWEDLFAMLGRRICGPLTGLGSSVRVTQVFGRHNVKFAVESRFETGEEEPKCAVHEFCGLDAGWTDHTDVDNVVEQFCVLVLRSIVLHAKTQTISAREFSSIALVLAVCSSSEDSGCACLGDDPELRRFLPRAIYLSSLTTIAMAGLLDLANTCCGRPSSCKGGLESLLSPSNLFGGKFLLLWAGKVVLASLGFTQSNRVGHKTAELSFDHKRDSHFPCQAMIGSANALIQSSLKGLVDPFGAKAMSSDKSEPRPTPLQPEAVVVSANASSNPFALLEDLDS